MPRQQARQGDVLLIPRSKLPAGAKPVLTEEGAPAPLKIVGERSNHAHVLDCPTYQNEEGTLFVYLDETALLEHIELTGGARDESIPDYLQQQQPGEELHKPIPLDPGWWEVRQQTERSIEVERNIYRWD